TAVDFLAKKGNKIAVDPNLKLSDDLHLLLVKEFNKDMALKMESERISQERQQKEKSSLVAIDGFAPVEKPAEKPIEKPVEKKEEKADDVIPVIVPKEARPSITPVGHIDLDKPIVPAETKVQEEPEAVVEEKDEVVETVE